jgi:hypothetical protein
MEQMHRLAQRDTPFGWGEIKSRNPEKPNSNFFVPEAANYLFLGNEDLGQASASRVVYAQHP